MDEGKELKMMLIKSLVIGSFNSMRDMFLGPWLPGILFVMILAVVAVLR